MTISLHSDVAGMRLPPPAQNSKLDSHRRLWNAFGWEQKLPFDVMIREQEGFFDFMRESRLIYSVRGYQRGDDQREQTIDAGLKVDLDGRPYLLKEGIWEPWETLKNKVIYDEKRQCILSKNDPTQEWIYVYPNGLIPQKSAGYFEPVFNLHPNELQRLKDFCGVTPEKSQIIQVFTTDAPSFHVGLRLIDDQGDVRSFSFRTPGDEEHMIDLRTYNAEITVPDFTEHRKFDTRRVTSIAITPENFEKAFAKVKSYSDAPFRFNYIHQNCSTFATQVLNEAGIEVNFTTNATSFFWEISKATPYLGLAIWAIDTLARSIIKFTSWMVPNFLMTPICFVISIITWPIKNITTLFRNLLIGYLGGTKEAIPTRTGAVENWDNSQTLTSFSTLMNWTDLFKDDVGKIYSTPELARWQLEEMRKQTFTQSYQGFPTYVIVP